MRSFIFFAIVLGFTVGHAKESFPLNVKYHIDVWSKSGHQITVTVTNPSLTSTSSWIVNFTLPEHQSISNLWNALFVADGQKITVKNPQWITGGVIRPECSVSFSMTILNPYSEEKELIDLSATANPQ